MVTLPEQKILYGIAVADVFITCSLAIISVIFILFGIKWGFYLSSVGKFLLCLGQYRNNNIELEVSES